LAQNEDKKNCTELKILTRLLSVSGQ